MKTIKCSFSMLKDFGGCQYRCQQVNILKKYPFVDSIHTLHGKEVHSAIEDYIKDGVSLPDKFGKFRPTVEKIVGQIGDKFCEYKIAVKRDKSPCEFKDKDAWIVAILDFVVISQDGTRALIIDWKTGGKNYPDTKQLELAFLLLYAKFPSLKTVESYLVFLEHGIKVHETYSTCDADKYWAMWESDYKKLELACEANIFKKKKTPLCNWCPVVDCEFNPKKLKHD